MKSVKNMTIQEIYEELEARPELTKVMKFAMKNPEKVPALTKVLNKVSTGMNINEAYIYMQEQLA